MSPKKVPIGQKGVSLIQITFLGALLAGVSLFALRQAKNIGQSSGIALAKLERAYLEERVANMLSSSEQCAAQFKGLVFKNALNASGRLDPRAPDLVSGIVAGLSSLKREEDGRLSQVGPFAPALGKTAIKEVRLRLEPDDFGFPLENGSVVNSFGKVAVSGKESHVRNIDFRFEHPLYLELTVQGRDLEVSSCDYALSRKRVYRVFSGSGSFNKEGSRCKLSYKLELQDGRVCDKTADLGNPGSNSCEDLVKREKNKDEPLGCAALKSVEVIGISFNDGRLKGLYFEF